MLKLLVGIQAFNSRKIESISSSQAFVLDMEIKKRLQKQFIALLRGIPETNISYFEPVQRCSQSDQILSFSVLY
jgi:hypothetical protein